jgi:hypothetical protein
VKRFDETILLAVILVLAGLSVYAMAASLPKVGC